MIRKKEGTSCRGVRKTLHPSLMKRGLERTWFGILGYLRREHMASMVVGAGKREMRRGSSVREKPGKPQEATGPTPGGNLSMGGT